MGTLVSELITLLRLRLNESSTNFHAEADLIKYANEAQKYVVKEVKPLEAVHTDTIDTSQADPEQYSLPTDCLALRRVTLDNKDLFPINFLDIKMAGIDTDDTVGGTYVYWEWNDVLYLYPTPGAGENGKSLKVLYYKKPTAITLSTQSLDVGDEYDDIVVSYMEYLGWKKDGEPDFADYAMSECVAKIDKIKRQRKEDKLDRPPRFRFADNINLTDPLHGYRFRIGGR